ncbi:MAG: DNA repair protein RecO, partial [Actinobacteria bacterium]|nr:DNA repair protein RecO [Actinomycetota bacterium]
RFELHVAGAPHHGQQVLLREAACPQVALEQEASPALYRMLVGALRALDERPQSDSRPLVAPAYFWKLLSLEGFHPSLDECVRCGHAGHLVALVPESDGAVCEACVAQPPNAESAEALAAVRRILGGGLREVLDHPPPARVIREVERLALRAVEFHLERRLRSAALLHEGTFAVS